MSCMNFAGGADLIMDKLEFVNYINVSIAFSLLPHSLTLKSATIYLNSSITIGSIGLDTRLFVFLKVFEVELKPPAPPLTVMLAVLLLKSDVEVNLPNPSLPAGFYL